ncbi:MAG: Helicase associated domain protein [Clostridiales bacterium]|nr:Helicase associated domain protein [Clostridiales bacterium]
MDVKLYEHNRAAYEAAVAMMGQTGKAAIVHPTGTGKSFIGFRLCADHPEQKILWLSPSEYIFKTQLENLKAATGGELPGNIVFCTYAKLMWMEEDEMAGICMDGDDSSDGSSSADMPDGSQRSSASACIILDEFHRCGAQMWGQGVQKLLSVFPDTPLLGLSATNIRYLDNQRDMAAELFDGNIASEMSLGEAIVRGILNPPKYVLSVYSCQQSLEKYEQRIQTAKSRVVRDTCEQYLEELKRALEMSEGLDEVFDKHMADRTGKYIVFCSNKEHMDEMMGHLEWFAKVDAHPHVYSLYASDPGADQAFDDFRADHDTSHLRLLYCIDALNEGIHVEGISGVILLRPTVSPIIYKQQIGRAFSASRQKDTVIFDIVMNVDCLQSIGLMEEEMQLVTAYYRDHGESELVVNEHFRIIDEVRDCRELFNKLNDMLSASWDMMFGCAKRYYEEHGNLEMLAGYMTEDGYPLGMWIATQRGIRKGSTRGCLTEERIRKLDSIGMVWESVPDQLWEKNYAAAKAYQEANGNLDVRWDYVTEDGIPLGKWINNVRTFEKAGVRQKYLTPERIKMLDDLGMIWAKQDYLWERNYAAACAYYREHGNLEVPHSYVNADGIKLGNWIYLMRKYRAQGTEDESADGDLQGQGIQRKKRMAGALPTEEQVKKLDEIGMNWTNTPDTRWEKGYQAA